jgi:hypothetical protein
MLNKKKINLFIIWGFLFLKIIPVLHIKNNLIIMEYFLNFIFTINYTYYFLKIPKNYNEMNTAIVFNILLLISILPIQIALGNIKIYMINCISIYYYINNLLCFNEDDSVIILPQHSEIKSENCSICLSTEENQITLPCNHHYHKKCILEWFNNIKTCPLCRQPYINV